MQNNTSGDQECRLYVKRVSLLESSSSEKDLRVIVNNHLKVSSQSSAMARWLI